jgi:hypothetical protein
MPESRKRPGHPYHKPADIPASQRVKGRVFWALLLGIFGFLIALFANGTDYRVFSVATLGGILIGYFTGKHMESKK